MPSYSPTITVSSTPALQISMAGGVTYEEFLSSLGQFVYKVNSYFLQCQSLQQLQQAIAYNIFDSSGNVLAQAIIQNPDPYQYTASIVQDLKDMGIILNGQSTISFNVLPGEFITMSLCTVQVSNQDELNRMHEDNFEQADDSNGNLQLFEDYSNCLE